MQGLLREARRFFRCSFAASNFQAMCQEKLHIETFSISEEMMPNGHSGGFYLERKELEKLLVVLEYNAEVGDTSEKPVTTAGLAEILDHCNDDRLIVEEQDHGWYIIWFTYPKDWILVTSKSPL